MKEILELEVKWSMKFSVGIWGVWMRRNNATFTKETEDVDRKGWTLQKYLVEITSTFSNIGVTRGGQRRQTTIFGGMDTIIEGMGQAKH